MTRLCRQLLPLAPTDPLSLCVSNAGLLAEQAQGAG